MGRVGGVGAWVHGWRGSKICLDHGGCVSIKFWRVSKNRVGGVGRSFRVGGVGP